MEALDLAHRLGLRVIVASGRTLPDLRRFFSGLAPVDAFVAENGAIIHLPKHPIERATGLAIGAAIQARLRRDPPRPIVFGRVVASFPMSARGWAERRLRGLPVELVRNVDRMMVLPFGVTKARGIERILRGWGYPPRAYAAVGDADNDVPMLERAALSAAVRNASPAALAAARIHCRRPMGRGVLEFVSGPLRAHVVRSAVAVT
jgi:hydroxymethylpyrimidine pyrophosphatase-like HAD family hydrolase